jgi:hypothetical protein
MVKQLCPYAFVAQRRNNDYEFITEPLNGEPYVTLVGSRNEDYKRRWILIKRTKQDYATKNLSAAIGLHEIAKENEYLSFIGRFAAGIKVPDGGISIFFDPTIYQDETSILAVGRNSYEDGICEMIKSSVGEERIEKSFRYEGLNLFVGLEFNIHYLNTRRRFVKNELANINSLPGLHLRDINSIDLKVIKAIVNSFGRKDLY